MKPSPGCYVRRAILVLGMHRSGTSVVTRTLGLRGAALPLNTIPAGFDNETGFWEPLDIVRLHDEILASAGSSWDDIATFPQAWFSSGAAETFRSRLAEALVRDFPAASLFALKDPRLCRLVPLWLSVLRTLAIEPLFVIPVRNPLEIAASLSKRNSLQEEHSLLLWLRHFIEAEQATRNHKRSFIRYDSLLADWRRTTDRIAQDLGISWAHQSATADEEINQFVSSALRHHHASDHEVYARTNVSRWVKTTLSWALRATDQTPTDFEPIDAVSRELESANLAFMPIIIDGRRSVAKLNQDIAHSDEQLQALRIAKELELQQVRADLQSNGIVLQQLQSEIGQLTMELQDAREATRKEAEECAAVRLDTKARITALRDACDQSRSELADLRSAHDKIITSTSWRALGPVRSAAAAVPLSIRKHLRRGLKLLYWIATPQKTTQRLTFLSTRRDDANLSDVRASPPSAAANQDSAADHVAMTASGAATTTSAARAGLVPTAAPPPLFEPIGHH